MSFISDLARLGILPLQHFEAASKSAVSDATPVPGFAGGSTTSAAGGSYPPENKITVYGARVIGRDPALGIYLIDPDTYGPVHGGMVWLSSKGVDPSGVTRNVPLWTGAVAAKYVSQGKVMPVFGAAPASGDDVLVTDGALKSLSPASSVFLSAQPGGMPGVMVPCTNPGQQEAIFVPAGGILVAPFKGSGRGTGVYDLDPKGQLDPSNFAELESLVRVYDCAPGQKAKAGTKPGSLAWQLGAARSGNDPGYGAVADTPAGGGSGSGGGGTGDGDSSGASSSGEPNLLIVTNDQLYRELRVGFDAVALQGPSGGPPKTQGGSKGGAPKQVIAYASYTQGGTHHVGSGSDKHKIKTTKDGLVVNPLHFNPKANWYLDEKRDAPFKFDEAPWIPPGPDLPLIVEAYLRYDKGDAKGGKPTPGGGYNSGNSSGGYGSTGTQGGDPGTPGGIFRWESSSVADKADGDPPPPGIPEIPEIPNTPVFNITRREEEFFTTENQNIPVFMRTRIDPKASLLTQTTPSSVSQYTNPNALAFQQQPPAPVSSATALPSVFAAAAAADAQQTSNLPPTRGRPYLRTPMEWAVPALLARPQPLNSYTADHRYPTGKLTREQFAAYDSAPVTGKLEAYGDQGGGGFGYQGDKANGLYARGSGTRGGFALVPANVDLQDVIHGRPLPASVSEVHMTLATRSAQLVFGNPNRAGKTPTSMVHSTFDNGSGLTYLISPTNSSGVKKSFAAFLTATDAEGTNASAQNQLYAAPFATGNVNGGEHQFTVGLKGASGAQANTGIKIASFGAAATKLFLTDGATTALNVDTAGNKVQIGNNAGGQIGFYGVTTVARQTTFGAITDNTTGVPSTTYAAVPAAYSQADQQTRWASVADQISKIRVALVNYGLST